MPEKSNQSIADYINIIWTIAAKDIVDALKNRIVISMIIILSIILLTPKLLPYIFEQPRLALPVYDLGDSPLTEELKKVPTISVSVMHSEQEFRQALCSASYPTIGLLLPVSEAADVNRTVNLQGSICWSKRHQVSAVLPKLEGLISQTLGQPVSINVEGNIVYPPTEGVMTLSIATINSVLMILLIGCFLIPSLLFEEKESKTMQALLVSPASIGQVVVGKALAGLFYILLTGVLFLIIVWVDVVHWEIALLFIFSGGLLSVAVGLLFGSFFEKQQDMVGWMAAVLLLLIGAVLVKMIGVELPVLINRILDWAPSVALAQICRAIYSESVPVLQLWTSFGGVVAISLLLYALVVWKVQQFDR